MHDTANFNEYIKYLQHAHAGNHFSYDPSQGDYRAWAKGVREVLAQHLTLTDYDTPLNPKILRRDQMDGYVQETLEISVNGYLRLRGYALIPDDAPRPMPAVVLLSGHGWQYHYDIVKMLNNGQEKEPIIAENRRLRFGDRAVANDMVKLGYFILYFETWYFGNYNLDVENVPQLFKDEFGVSLEGLTPGTDEYITARNLFTRRFEAYMYKYLAFAGVSWSGLNLESDMKAVDYLLTRSEVDKNRIGCLGLSLGGFRSMLLTGMDERIKCAVIAGWMCTQEGMAEAGAKFHTFMMFQPSLWNLIDFPDLAALGAPNALLVLNGLRDEQFFGADKAAERMERIYADAGASGKYASKFYDTPHCFNQDMQRDAYAFLEEHLKNLK